MQVGSPLQHSTVRFGVFGESAERRLTRARENRNGFTNPVDQLFQRFAPESVEDLSKAPMMDDQFADQMVGLLDTQYSTDTTNSASPADARRFGQELKELTKRLARAKYYVPDRVVSAIERAYRVISEGQQVQSHQALIGELDGANS